MPALREGLDYNRITSSVWSDRMEIIAVELESQRNKKCLVCVCYPTCPHSYINDNNQLTTCVIIIITVKIVETLQTSILVSTAHLKITIWRTLWRGKEQVWQ